ncbi:hypothetical protein EYF80_016956 [Liparis tanakae]|uniref:Uncharacterized protein n=1 Tax=Liparis tanakae TaxID=230148 RepID=A0A4Z2I5V4_9TELE|nr:hypothetical protein EYF80_016956 [Liparis tanakae]
MVREIRGAHSRYAAGSDDKRGGSLFGRAVGPAGEKTAGSSALVNIRRTEGPRKRERHNPAHRTALPGLQGAELHCNQTK